MCFLQRRSLRKLADFIRRDHRPTGKSSHAVLQSVHPRWKCGNYDPLILLAAFCQVPPSVSSLCTIIGQAYEGPLNCPIRDRVWEAPIGPSRCRRRDLCEFSFFPQEGAWRLRKPKPPLSCVHLWTFFNTKKGVI